MNWSGGKDSSLCLYKALSAKMTVRKLVTTMNTMQNRISMHGVRRELLEHQAASVQLPLHTIELPEQPGMEAYETEISNTHAALKKEGYTHAVYGDIFLEDLKKYREELLQKDELKAVFPLWQKNSKSLLDEFISLGFKAIIVCVNSNFLDQSFCGRIIDESFINDLPGNVDVCGENGEYHSFVFDGPIFSTPVGIQKGAIVFKEYAAPKNKEDDCFLNKPQPAAGFYFCDLY